MGLVNRGRSKLGAFIRSPLGVKTRSNGSTTVLIPSGFCHSLKQDFPSFGTKFSITTVANSNFTGSDDAGVLPVGGNTWQRIRRGVSFALASSYPSGTTLSLELDYFNNPNVSASDSEMNFSPTYDVLLYTTNFSKSSLDWELNSSQINDFPPQATNLVPGLIALTLLQMAPFMVNGGISIILGSKNELQSLSSSESILAMPNPIAKLVIP